MGDDLSEHRGGHERRPPLFIIVRKQTALQDIEVIDDRVGKPSPSPKSVSKKEHQ